MNDVPLTLENFRDELDENILERGWFYFQKGWVKSPREIMPGYFEAVVNEVSTYAVSYSMDENGIFTDDFCTCGDPKNAMCRHKAAVLFWLEEEGKKRLPESEHIL
jgi:uncharacterized Zn finger protein